MAADAKPSGLVQGTALRRLERDGLISGDWRVTENDRRAGIARILGASLGGV